MGAEFNGVFDMAVPVTELYGGLLAVLFVALSMNVSRVRGQTKVFLEHDKPVPEALHLAQRAQGNASEYIPLGVALLLAAELGGGGWLMLHLLGGGLLLGRVLHALGVTRKLGAIQIPGIMLTWLVLLAEGIYLLVLRFR